MKKVTIYTDGACSGNPGPGGYGAVLRYGGRSKELSGGFRRTTNNRMELLAVITGLETLRDPCDVTIYSDSRYIVDAVNKGWARRWKANGWRTAGRKPVRNRDLWQDLDRARERHEVEWVWVRAHAGHPENERVDRLARCAARAAAL